MQIWDVQLMSLANDFSNDRQGRRFKDVLHDSRVNFKLVLDFFDNPNRQQRMIESELHHDRPPLAGVIKELEVQPDVNAFFRTNGSQTTRRFRQAVGVVVRIVMEQHGWKTTGRKGSLGSRKKATFGTTSPGVNEGGLSRWFTRAERYEQ